MDCWSLETALYSLEYSALIHISGEWNEDQRTEYSQRQSEEDRAGRGEQRGDDRALGRSGGHVRDHQGVSRTAGTQGWGQRVCGDQGLQRHGGSGLKRRSGRPNSADRDHALAPAVVPAEQPARRSRRAGTRVIGEAAKRTHRVPREAKREAAEAVGA